jgi:sec-independent protein translocase protein TatA
MMTCEHCLTTLAFWNFSGWELLVIFAIGLLVFGSRLPSVGRGLGKSISEFKKGLKDVENEVNAEDDRKAMTDRPYRAPLSSGQDVRVSQADAPDAPHTGTAAPR